MDNCKKLYVGIDIHSRQHKVALISTDSLKWEGKFWEKSRTLNIRNSNNDFIRLDNTIKSYNANSDEVAIAVDHTGGHYSEPIVYFLLNKGYKIYYLESKAIKAARERFLNEENKNDIIDSSCIAYMLYLRDYHQLLFNISTIIPEIESNISILNSLILQRCQLNKLLNQVTNRLHQLLLAVFPEGEAQCFKQLLEVIPYYPTPFDIIKSNDLVKVKKLCDADKQAIINLASNTVGVPGNVYKWLIKDLGHQRNDVVKKLEVLNSKLRQRVKEHPYSNILLSFPFIGEITAATIIAIVKDIDRWPNKKKLKKAMGIYSISTQSGGSTAQYKQGKGGSRHGRRVLFQICMGCITTRAPENDFRDYYYRQVSRGKVRIKSLFSTMGKLVEIIYHCLKTGQHYQYQGIYKS